MSYRRFVDREGRSWEVRDRSRSRWEFHPISGNTSSAVPVSAPTYESDPYELSDQELQKLLDQELGRPARSASKSPFID